MPRSRLWGISFSEEQSVSFPDVWKPLLSSAHDDDWYLSCGSSASLASVSLLWERSCWLSILSSSRKLVMSLATASTSLWKRRNNVRVSGTVVLTRTGTPILENNCLKGQSTYGIEYDWQHPTCEGTPRQAITSTSEQINPFPSVPAAKFLTIHS